MSTEQSGKAGELEPFENFEQLGRRAVACKRWRWMPGMSTVDGHRVVIASHDVREMVYNDEGKCKPGCVEDFMPDLDRKSTRLNSSHT